MESRAPEGRDGAGAVELLSGGRGKGGGAEGREAFGREGGGGGVDARGVDARSGGNVDERGVDGGLEAGLGALGVAASSDVAAAEAVADGCSGSLLIKGEVAARGSAGSLSQPESMSSVDAELADGPGAPSPMSDPYRSLGTCGRPLLALFLKHFDHSAHFSRAFAGEAGLTIRLAHASAVR